MSDNSENTQSEQPSQSEGQPLEGGRRALVTTLAVVVVLAIVGIAIFNFEGSATDAESEQALSDLEFTTPDGSVETIATYEGQPLVVNFFASWCGPCRGELPDFETVHQATKDDVTFLGISHDLDIPSWEGLIEETGVTFPTVYQPNQEIFEELDAKGMPTTALVSADGEVLEVHSGLLTEETLSELIDKNLTS